MNTKLSSMGVESTTVKTGKMSACAALYCGVCMDGKDKGAALHAFPLDKPAFLKQWVCFTGRKNFTPTIGSRMCSKHFTADCFIPDPYAHYRASLAKASGKAYSEKPSYILRRDAVPTLFTLEQALSWKQYVTSMQSIQVQDTTVSSLNLDSRDSLKKSSAPIKFSEQEKRKSSPLVSLLPKKLALTKSFDTETRSTLELECANPLVEPTRNSLTISTTVIKFNKKDKSKSFIEAFTTKKMLLRPLLPKKLVVGKTLSAENQSPPKLESVTLENRNRSTNPVRFNDKEKPKPCQPLLVSLLPEKVVTSKSFDAESVTASELESENAFVAFTKTSPHSLFSNKTQNVTESTDANKDNKFLVFQTNLEELLQFCSKCGKPVRKKEGFMWKSLAAYRIACRGGHTYDWHSQPPVDGDKLVDICVFHSADGLDDGIVSDQKRLHPEGLSRKYPSPSSNEDHTYAKNMWEISGPSYFSQEHNYSTKVPMPAKDVRILRLKPRKKKKVPTATLR